MLDRVPTKPNRYAVYDDNHNFLRYEYHERADEPTQAGDALNKANLLPDAVATALDLTGNPQVKDALEKLKTLVNTAQTTANGRAQIATGSYTGTGTHGASNPNSITFPFVPKIVFMRGVDGGYVPFPYFWGTGSFYLDIGNSSQSVTVTVSGKTMQWYTGHPNYQLNESGKTYYWLAIS